MNIFLLIIQVLLGGLYLLAGAYKIAGQAPMLEASMPGMAISLIRIIGMLEALAGIGLLLPLFRRSWSAFAGWAAAILAIEAVLFVVYHFKHGANGPGVATLVLGLLAAFVAWKKLG